MEQKESILEKSESWKMFNDISPKYDLLNHLLSFGLDIAWRKELKHYLLRRGDQKILDIATGTGDVLLSLFASNKTIYMGYGIDMADKMLDIARKKVYKKRLESNIHLQHADAHQLPFEDNYFDTTTIAFGIRNMQDHNKVLREMYRVLNKGGRTLILEFSFPSKGLIRSLHLFYLRNIVPFIGFLFTGHYKAYRYLNKTIESFPYGKEFLSLLEQAGFKNVQCFPLLFGVASIYQGDKA